MKNARDWYLTDWFVCTPGPQVLERVVEFPLSPINTRPTVKRTSFQIHDAAYIIYN
jgi:hypothetical protein